MKGYSQDGNGNRLGCFLASLWLLIAYPLFFILLMGGGGCEGAPQPCTAKRWPEFVFVAVIVALGISTAWATKTLRLGKRDMLWWAALSLAAALLSLAMFLGWQLASIFWR